MSRWRKEYQDNGEFGHRENKKKPATVTFEEAQTEIKQLCKQLEDKKLENMVLRDMKKGRLLTNDSVLIVLKMEQSGIPGQEPLPDHQIVPGLVLSVCNSGASGKKTHANAQQQRSAGLFRVLRNV